MNTKEFEKQAEDLIYKEVAKSTNLILGKNKTAALSTGIFLKLPIVVTAEQVPEPLPKALVSIESFMERFAAYTKLGDTTKVYFTFMYHTEKDLSQILDKITRHSLFLGFVYIHEVQHIIRKHITHNYNNMMLRLAEGLQHPHQAINIAEDHAINYSIKDFFVASGLSKEWATFEGAMCYKYEYHEAKMSDIDIIKDMKKNAQQITITCMGNGFEKVESNGASSIQPGAEEKAGKGTGNGEEEEGEGGDAPKQSKTSTEQDDADNALADLATSLQDIISTHTKGTAIGELMNDIFDSVKVETGWFKKLKASFKRQVYYMTHEYTSSWSNINNTYRHIYKAPKKQFYDNKIEIILSVDHSGSVGTVELQKLLYLIEEEGKKISKINVLIHDTAIMKTFEIANDFDITSSENFKQALATRYTAGGTSHECVFEHIQNMTIPDVNKVVYMSFSDNYSDIEQCFNKYPIMKKLNNYWVCTVNNPMRVKGTNITMI